MQIGVGANGQEIAGAIPAPDATMVNARALGAAAAETMTIPSGAKYVVFSANLDFYANYTTTATVPGDTTDGTASELNPTIRTLEDTDIISIIAPAITIVTCTFYI